MAQITNEDIKRLMVFPENKQTIEEPLYYKNEIIGKAVTGADENRTFARSVIITYTIENEKIRDDIQNGKKRITITPLRHLVIDIIKTEKNEGDTV